LTSQTDHLSNNRELWRRSGDLEKKTRIQTDPDDFDANGILRRASMRTGLECFVAVVQLDDRCLDESRNYSNHLSIALFLFFKRALEI